MELKLKDLYNSFREPKLIKHFKDSIDERASELNERLYVMEVCGGHTHTIMKYGLNQLMPKNISFVHGPGCPVCIMPKERINNAIELANIKDVILVTLGDMIRVPASASSLAQERAKGCDIRALYSPLDALKIAQENPTKKVVFFAIGFETTTPMSASLIQKAIELNLKNIYFHINHVLVPPAIEAIMDSDDVLVNSFIAPSHVSVITGAKIYKDLSTKYNTPIVVSGFEPVDVMSSVSMLIDMKNSNDYSTKIEYSRFVTDDGNTKAQELINRYLTPRSSFRWRGLGDIANSALRLKDEYSQYDAEIVFKDFLSDDKIDDHKMCICADILKGKAKPNDCKVFKKICTPSNPLGSCMVSSEGACNAYYKFGI